MGLVLFSTMALSSPYLQNVIGYPIITAGLLLASPGCGTFGRHDDGRPPDAIYRSAHADHRRAQHTCLSLFYMTGWTDQTGVPEIVTLSIVQGFGFGLVFVPLSTVDFLTLPNHLRTDGTAMADPDAYVASSIGISVVISAADGGLAAHLCGAVAARQFRSTMPLPDARRARHDRHGHRQGPRHDGHHGQFAGANHRLLARLQMVMIFTLCAIPLTLMIGSSKAALRKQSIAPEHAVIE